MKAIQRRSVPGLLLALAIFHFAIPAPPGSAVEKGRVVIDGRVTIDVEVARSPEAQVKGLGGRSSLKKGTGMLFPYDKLDYRIFWMNGMLMSLDILWVRAGRIVAVEANIPPPTANTPVAVFSHVADLVLEVPGGYAHEMGIRVGQPVRVRYGSSSQ